MVSEKWKACVGVRAVQGGCPERSRETRRVGSMNVGLRGSTTPKKLG
jgi:hypothetical protein